MQRRLPLSRISPCPRSNTSQTCSEKRPDLSTWNTPKVTDLSEVFRGATSFQVNVATWDYSGVVSFRKTFLLASSFNGDVSGWDTSNAHDLMKAFAAATSFHKPIGDVSKVETLNGLFDRVASFNQDISSWNTSNVADMKELLTDAIALDQDISGWDARPLWAVSFNQDLAVSNVCELQDTFVGATSFRQDSNPYDFESLLAGLQLGELFNVANRCIVWWWWSSSSSQKRKTVTYRKHSLSQTARWNHHHHHNLSLYTLWVSMRSCVECMCMQ